MRGGIWVLSCYHQISQNNYEMHDTLMNIEVKHFMCSSCFTTKHHLWTETNLNTRSAPIQSQWIAPSAQKLMWMLIGNFLVKLGLAQSPGVLTGNLWQQNVFPSLRSRWLMAEATAVLEGCKWAAEMGLARVQLESDSMELVESVNGNIRSGRWSLCPILSQIRHYQAQFTSWSCSWVSRNFNQAAILWRRWHSRGRVQRFGYPGPPPLWCTSSTVMGSLVLCNILVTLIRTLMTSLSLECHSTIQVGCVLVQFGRLLCYVYLLLSHCVLFELPAS